MAKLMERVTVMIKKVNGVAVLTRRGSVENVLEQKGSGELVRLVKED